MGEPSRETPQVADISPEADDIKLMRRAENGDSAAFHALVDHHAQRLFRLAVSLIGNATDAEDVLQETFVGAFRGLKSFEGRASVKIWLTRILVNQAARWRRDRRGRSTEAMPGDVAARAGAAESAIDVRAAIQQLSPDHQQVLLLREFESLTYEEIADVLDVPRGTVESRLHRARAGLKEKLKSYLP
jgi:RNA polymerase sigma-70 factor (ECF subfamily)